MLVRNFRVTTTLFLLFTFVCVPLAVQAEVNIDAPPAETTAPAVKEGLKFTLEQSDIVSWGKVRSGLSIRMNASKTQEFATLTTSNIGKPVVLFLGPMEVETVTIRGPVVSGTIILAGLKAETERNVRAFLTTPQKKSDGGTPQ